MRRFLNQSALRTSLFFREEQGQDLVEYSLLLGFLALATLAVMQSASGSMRGIFSAVGVGLSSAQTAAS